MRADVVVVGGGIGGMAAALRLAGAGHAVTILERSDRLGGHLAQREIEGFRFDTGPSVLALPRLLDELWDESGLGRFGERCRPVRLDPVCRYEWPDGSAWEARSSAADTEAAVEAFSPGEGPRWRAFHERAARSWDAAARSLFARPVGARRTIARVRSPQDWRAIRDLDRLVTLGARAERAFEDPRMRQWARSIATRVGVNPLAAPATLAAFAAVEQEHGAWRIPGGLAGLATVLAEGLADLQVTVRLGAEAERIGSDSERVHGVGLTSGEWIPADIVVAGVDAGQVYGALLPDPELEAASARAGRTASVFGLLIGADAPVLPKPVIHHTVSFPADAERELDELWRRGDPPGDPTLTACISSLVDPMDAPEGAENWMVTVTVPGGDTSAWEHHAEPYRDHVLEVMARRGWDLSGRTRFVETLTPADIAERLRAPGGTAWGAGHHGRRAWFGRPANRGPRQGLYLVGASAHPGGGIPLVLTGARIVAHLVAADVRPSFS